MGLFSFNDEYNCFREGYTIQGNDTPSRLEMNITVFERDTQSQNLFYLKVAKMNITVFERDTQS